MISFLDQNFSELNASIQKINPSKIFILVDENTHEYCLPTLLGNLEINIPFEIIEIESGEESKNINSAMQLWEVLSEFKADKKSLLLNLGGGMITDLGGFVASTYKRGIPFINIPTTLLAMVDASIGGKTGIDLHFYKNMIGTFAEAKNIFIYPEFLKTLSERELRAGFAEMLKHGLIADTRHWKALISEKGFSAEEFSYLIFQSAKIKFNIVEIDFKEENIRKILNFGHTIGHAIESLFLKAEYPILHGEAVAIGMICETYLSFLENLISEAETEHIILNIQRFFAHIDISHFTNEEIISIIFNDKKNQYGKINFSLIESIGKGNFDHQVPLKNITLSLDFYKNLVW